MKMLNLGILFALGYFCLPAYSQYSEHSGCYDCNFAPSGYIKTSEGSAKDVGYVRCALLQPEDFQFVDAPPCSSGKCFIRLDDNGLEYRGCADPANLPFGVDANINCKYQGPGKPLWYFCDGHLCNYGQIGQDEDHCGQSSTPPFYSTQAEPSPIDEPLHASDDSETNEYPVYDDEYQPVIVNSPDHLPPVNTETSYEPYEQPSQPNYEIQPYPNSQSNTEGYGDNQPSDTNPEYNEESHEKSWNNQQSQSQSKSGYNQDSYSKSGYNQASQQKSGYNQDNSKSGYNQLGTKSDHTVSKPHLDNSDHTYSERETGNTETLHNPALVAYAPFHNNVQMKMQHPEDFLKQFGFWYFLMPAYWMNYFGYQPGQYPQNEQNGGYLIPDAREYTGNEDGYGSSDGYGYETGTTDADNADHDTSDSTQDQHGYNPCQGCDDNPSGLYSDGTRPGQFIQCGCAIYDGVPCTCCYPFQMTCPNNTLFSDVTKTCVRFGDYPQHG